MEDLLIEYSAELYELQQQIEEFSESEYFDPLDRCYQEMLWRQTELTDLIDEINSRNDT